MKPIAAALVALVLGILTACASSGASAGAPGPAESAGTADAAGGAAPSLQTGAYTVAQAARGEATFSEACSLCHSPREFAGRVFEIRWSGGPVSDLYSFISSEMPYDNPGRLSEQQYADIVAYFLQLNAYAPGNSELPADAGALGGLMFP